MDGLNDVIERIMGDLLRFMLKKHTEFSWSVQDNHEIVASEMDDVVVDPNQSNIIILRHPLENWSITRFRKSDAPEITFPISAEIYNGKIVEANETMAYEIEGSIDDIMAWCMAIKLRLF